MARPGTKVFSDGKTAALIRVDQDGVIVRSVRKVTLKAERGHFYMGQAVKLDGGGYGAKPKVLTATGFEYLNSFSPLAWIPKGSLIDEDGKEVGNPLVRKVNGNVENVRIRRFAVGRSPDGTLRAYDLTLNYDPASYFQTEIYSEYTKKPFGSKGPVKPPVWGKMLNEGSVASWLRDHDTWASVPVAPGVVLAYDMTEASIQKCFKEYRQRSQFADRLARTICERNIYKKHFGFATVPDDGVVFLSCWAQPDIPIEELERGIVTKNGSIVLSGEEIQIDSAEVDASDEDLSAAGDDLSREEDFKTDKTEQSEPQPESRPVNIDKLKGLLRSKIRACGGKDNAVSILQHVLKEYKVKSIADISMVEDSDALNKMLAAFDSK